MKKKLALFMAITLVFVVFLTACSSTEPTEPETDGTGDPVEETDDTEDTDMDDTEDTDMDDPEEETGEELSTTVYFAEDEIDDKGWVATVIYVVNGTDVIKADFDAYYAEGDEYPIGTSKKEAARAGDYDIVAAGGKAPWNEQISWVEAAFIQNDSIDEIAYDEDGHETDGTTGASIHFEEYNTLVKEAMPAMMYYAEGPADNGWIPTVTYLDANGNIAWADFDAYMVDNTNSPDIPIGMTKKQASQAGLYDMSSAGAKAPWDEQISWVENYFVVNDSFSEIVFDEEGHETDATTGATISYIDYQELTDSAELVYLAYLQDDAPYEGWISTALVGTIGADVVYADLDGIYVEGSQYPLGSEKKEVSANGLYGMYEQGGSKAPWYVEISWVESYYETNNTVNNITLDDGGKDVDGLTGATMSINSYIVLLEDM